MVLRGETVYTSYPGFNLPLTENEIDENLTAIAVVPIRHKNNVIGCMNTASHTRRDVPEYYRTTIETIAAVIDSTVFRLRLEDELRQEKEKFPAFFNNIPAGTALTINPAKPFIVNEAFAQLMGYSREELQEKSVLETGKFIAHPDGFKAG